MEKENIREEVKMRIKKWAATQEDPEEAERDVLAGLNRSPKPIPNDRTFPGQEFHSKGGREAVPNFGGGLLAQRGVNLRDTVDPKDPQTQPSPVKITKIKEIR